MRPVHQFAPFLPPFALTHIVANGQSLSIGQQSTPATLTQPYRNLKLFDSSGSYTNPQAGTLSLVPLVAPQRPQSGAFPFLYPANMFTGGESAEITMANEIVRLAKLLGYVDYPIFASCTGVTGADMAQIQKGGADGSYEAGIFEAKCLASGAGFGGLAAAAGFRSVGAGAVLWTHGETDALTGGSANAYQAPFWNVQSNYEIDLRAIYGQTRGVPFFFSQQHCDPQSFQVGENTTALAMLSTFLLDPTRFLLTGPKYHGSYYTDRVHLTDYRWLGAKSAQAYIANELRRARRGPGWSPLYPSSITRTGQTVFINLNVPVGDFRAGILNPFASLGPVVFDTSHTAPHGAGTAYAMWAGAGGLEAYDTPMTPTSATNASPIVVGYSTPHGVQAGGEFVANIGIQGNTAANGVFAVDVVDSTHLSLRGTTGNGVFVASGLAFLPIGIANCTINGSQLVLGLARAPRTAMTVAYAQHSDAAYGTECGGFPDGRCGVIRDSDPSVAPGGFLNWNFLCAFAQVIA